MLRDEFPPISEVAKLFWEDDQLMVDLVNEVYQQDTKGLPKRPSLVPHILSVKPGRVPLKEQHIGHRKVAQNS